MADIKQLERALINADAAGDAEAARALAAEIRKMRAAPAQEPPKQERSMLDEVKQGAGNLIAGGVRGAGSIGATILAPYDMAMDALAGKGLSLESNRQRRADMDAGLQSLGAETDSLLYKGGKLGGEIAGTLGVGGALANGARAAGAAPALVNALATGGFRAGASAAATPGANLLQRALTYAPNMLTRAAGGAVTGGATAGLVNPEDAGLGALIGGGLPVAASAVGKAAQATGRALRGAPVSPEVASLAARAKNLGIDIPADRIVNSKPMNAVASSLNYVPFSGRAATEEAMQSQLNKALSRTFGQDSDNVTMALRKASDDLGREFDRVLQQNRVKIDDSFLQDLLTHEQRIKTELPFNASKHAHIPASGNVLKNQIDMILEKGATGEIDGQTAYNIKKTLDRMGKQNTPEAYYAREIKDSLMDALNRSLGSQEAAGFAATRKQYGNMRTLEKLAQNGAEGDISIGRLANLKNIKSGDLQELADIAAQFLKSREGQHGAMQRAVAGMAAGGLAGLPVLAGGAAAGRGVNMLLNSNLARNAVLGNSNPAVENALSKLLPLTYKTAPVLSAQ